MSESTSALLAAANQVEGLAFSMPAPNPWTPMFVGVAVAMRQEALGASRLAHEAPRPDEQGCPACATCGAPVGMDRPETEPNQQGEGRCARALAELVALKDLKARADRVMYSPGALTTDEYTDAINDYNRRKPLAWAEARAAVEALKSDEGDLGVTLPKP